MKASNEGWSKTGDEDFESSPKQEEDEESEGRDEEDENKSEELRSKSGDIFKDDDVVIDKDALPDEQ